MFLNIIKGLIIGVLMLIPGISGGTVAIMLGIYYKLIASVDTFFEKPKENIKYLLTIAVGGVLGVILFSKPILFLYNTYKMPMVYLFMGAVLGSVPLLIKCAGIKKIRLGTVTYLMFGIVIVMLLTLIPKNTFDINTDGITGYVILFAVGMLLATALVLPGISFSYMLLILGLYEQTLFSIETMQIPYLLFLGTGILLGTYLTAKVIRLVLRKYPQQTYLVIIGFVIASLKDIFPGVPVGAELYLSILIFLISFVTIYKLSEQN